MFLRCFFICVLTGSLFTLGIPPASGNGQALLNKKEQNLLLVIARDTLYNCLSGKALPPINRYPLTERLKKKRGCFVTLKKKQTGALRGCIGYITGRNPLAESVSNCTVMAATHDSRFPPMNPAEADTVAIEISILTPLKKIHTIEEIKIGTHGLFIENGTKSGLLLPQVPVEWGWNKNRFLHAVCRKAGLPSSAWKDERTGLYVFSAQICEEPGATEIGH